MARYWNGYRWVDDPPMARADAREAVVEPSQQDEVDTTPEQQVPGLPEQPVPNSVTIPLRLYPEKIVYASGKEIPGEEGVADEDDD